VEEIKRKPRSSELRNEFEELVKWGREFTKKNKITMKDILEDNRGRF